MRGSSQTYKKDYSSNARVSSQNKAKISTEQSQQPNNFNAVPRSMYKIGQNQKQSINSQGPRVIPPAKPDRSVPAISEANLKYDAVNRNFRKPQDKVESKIEKCQHMSEIDTLAKMIKETRMKLGQKDALLEQNRCDQVKLKKENFELKKKLLVYKASDVGNRPKKIVEENDVQLDAETEQLRQLQIAMQMEEVEKMKREREVIMSFMSQMQNQHHQARAEEDRMMQRVLEESKDQADPNTPNIDNMSYEQLLEYEEKQGKVSKGCTSEQIESIEIIYWSEGKTQGEQCSICCDNFSDGQGIKVLSCKHDYHQDCIDMWLNREKRCPVCNVTLFQSQKA